MAQGLVPALAKALALVSAPVLALATGLAKGLVLGWDLDLPGFHRTRQAPSVRRQSPHPNTNHTACRTQARGAVVPFENGFSGVEQCPIRALRLDPVRQRRCLANASGGLATIDDGSTLLICPARLIRSAIVLKPSTLLGLHQALRNRKYQSLMRFSVGTGQKG